MNGTESRSEREKRVEEIEFVPGPVPPLRPVDRYGFLKIVDSPSDDSIKFKSQIDRSRHVLFIVPHQTPFLTFSATVLGVFARYAFQSFTQHTLGNLSEL